MRAPLCSPSAATCALANGALRLRAPINPNKLSERASARGAGLWATLAGCDRDRVGRRSLDAVIRPTRCPQAVHTLSRGPCSRALGPRPRCETHHPSIRIGSNRIESNRIESNETSAAPATRQRSTFITDRLHLLLISDSCIYCIDDARSLILTTHLHVSTPTLHTCRNHARPERRAARRRAARRCRS